MGAQFLDRFEPNIPKPRSRETRNFAAREARQLDRALLRVDRLLLAEAPLRELPLPLREEPLPRNPGGKILKARLRKEVVWGGPVK